MDSITLIRPDDWHLHLRDGEALASTVAATAQTFARAIIMPNLSPPIINCEQALAYRERILAALPTTLSFEPLMTLYLTDNTSVDDIRKAKATGIIAAKLYPAGATTNSDAGVTQLEGLYPVLEVMQDCTMPLLIHGEVVDAAVDIFDREAVFIDQILEPLVARFPQLKVVLEHITTQHGVEFVESASDYVAATITAHHLLVNRNAMLVGGIRPDYYCLPILKREQDRKALLAAATCGASRFFLGTDSAPHAVAAKHTACGCAGIYTAPMALELYAEAFDSVNRLENLEAFASLNGSRFYGLPVNTTHTTLQRKALSIPETLPLGDTTVTPFRANSKLQWQQQGASM